MPKKYENLPESTMRNCGFFGRETPLVVAVLSCQPNRLCSQKIRPQPVLLTNPTRFFHARTLFSADVFDAKFAGPPRPIYQPPHWTQRRRNPRHARAPRAQEFGRTD